MANITYWNSVGAAWSRMKLVLFQPFNMEKWFIVGFAAWIAGLSGGGFSGGSSHNRRLNGGNGQVFVDFWHMHGPLILMCCAIIIPIMLAIGIALAWLHARGRFIFLDNLLYNRGAIGEPWKKYRMQGNSLFLWNLAIGLVWLIFLLLVTAAICVPPFLIALEGRHSMVGPGMLSIGFAVLMLIPFMLIMAYVQLMVTDFVTPIMLKYNLGIRAAWSRFNAILKPAFGPFILYGLMIFLVNIVVSAILVAAMFATCCCLLLVFAIPYIGTVALLPALVFRRWIGIDFLRQFGENIDDIVPQPEDAATPPPPELPPAAPPEGTAE